MVAKVGAAHCTTGPRGRNAEARVAPCLRCGDPSHQPAAALPYLSTAPYWASDGEREAHVASRYKVPAPKALGARQVAPDWGGGERVAAPCISLVAAEPSTRAEFGNTSNLWGVGHD